ncbi:MAG: cytochrome b/b6 domain-containing protein [Alphaproteobacteria bacterium]|nr:cytochrome b/b6 domain-containing protein [Alphaproteobacteria bacterium]
MSEGIDGAAVRSAVKPPEKADRFDPMSMAFHWLTVVLVVAQFATAFVLYWLEQDADELITVHRSTGSLLWVVVVARLVWRHGFAHLPAFPATMPRFQQRVAMLNEYALYSLLLLQPLTGLANTLFQGRSFELVIWQVPALLERNKRFTVSSTSFMNWARQPCSSWSRSMRRRPCFTAWSCATAFLHE